jgi:5-formyltetrahydrofolate cyclo-ligase
VAREALARDADLRSRKAALRDSVLAERRALGADLVADLSAAIQARLLGLEEFHRASLVHCYAGAKANEVRTDRILAETLRTGRRLAVPRVEGDDLVHHEIRSVTELFPSRFGLLEPDPGAPRVEPEEIDLVVVPGLAFDLTGNRLGFGKGYYDRFLTRVRAVKGALLYTLQIVDRVPADGRDVAVDLLVTERGVERCSRRPIS